MLRLFILGRLYKWWGRWDVTNLEGWKLHLLIKRWFIRVGSINLGELDLSILSLVAPVDHTVILMCRVLPSWMRRTISLEEFVLKIEKFFRERRWNTHNNNNMAEERALKQYAIPSSDEPYVVIMYPTVEDNKTCTYLLSAAKSIFRITHWGSEISYFNFFKT